MECTYAFWNNKGGTGKTSLAFQAITGYAEKFPDKKILAIDLCPQANLSELMLGGLCNKGSEKLLSRVRTRYFQRNKNRVCRGHGGVACVPCFIFPKASWSVSNRSFPVLTVLRVSMTDASSAASYTSSSTGFSGRMHLMSTARTKRCTIDSSGGADSVFSIKFSLSWPTKRLLMAH